jgi:hypothetical protein
MTAALFNSKGDQAMAARSNQAQEAKESDIAREVRFAAEHARMQAKRRQMEIDILRLMYGTMELWRSCGERLCRRSHRCCGGPQFPCSLALPPRTATEEETAEAMAELSAALKARLRERESAKGQVVKDNDAAADKSRR